MLRRTDVIVAAAVVGLAIAVALPAVFQAREASRRTQCRNNLKQLGLGLANYHDSFSMFPMGTVGGPNFPPEHRWSFYPSMKGWLSQDAEPPIDYLTDSRNSKNWPLTYKVRKRKVMTIHLYPPQVVTCPKGTADVGELDQTYAGYVGVTGVGAQSPLVDADHRQAGAWAYDRQTSLCEITAPLSNTLLMVETAADRDVWLFGGRPTTRWFDSTGPQIGIGRNFGGFHTGMANGVRADGSVSGISENIDPAVLLRMARINDDGGTSDNRTDLTVP